ncbi:L-lactate dehydrogenase [Listeria welshimeri]|uniref:L-lactate dehydrogenase n=1 Tax=Listeria welshimeri TaxID=1643 RepID=A0ABX4IB37_LISWE|nr:L-lactate dehydrogenase [Listeria welshimeri]MBC1243673.1 L-lactate dehydrogenase [Listeria welshimeri]MBC1629095.1 L-lactate dehydrogenase [Listeria welshimeri]MBC1706949.1 L-lactate dehydrogenase [Listeria welshimeri]MBC1712255.1 L-lactate dehydrogenase [Listeria welshimeri]MBC2339302.1 L-lactate dehydrogenase [Listeria welshimeri]
MKRKVGIIGAGHVGSDVAFSLVTQGICDEIILIDKVEAKAESEALELRDMSSMTHFYTTVTANDWDGLKEADVIIMAVGPETLLRQDRMEELVETSRSVAEIVPKILATGFKGIFVNITNPCDVITMLIQKITGFDHSRVFGTGTSLDTARMRRVVGEALHINPKSVEGYVLGEHGESQFVAWSTVKIGGVHITDYKTETTLDLPALKDTVRFGGWNILTGKGWTSFGIATATANIVGALLSDAKQVFPLAVFSEQTNTYIGQPAIIGANGVIDILEPSLTKEEQANFSNSAAVIRKAFDLL